MTVLVFKILLAWTLLSFPAGCLIGKCIRGPVRYRERVASAVKA